MQSASRDKRVDGVVLHERWLDIHCMAYILMTDEPATNLSRIFYNVRVSTCYYVTPTLRA